MKLNLYVFLKAVSHISAFFVCQPIIFNLLILIILNFVTVSFDFYLAFTAPDEGEFCLTEILGNKIITLYTKIRLHLATVCPSGPCLELPNKIGNQQRREQVACAQTSPIFFAIRVRERK